MEYTIKPIGYIHNDYVTKFGIPRQSNVVKDIESTITFEKEYDIEAAFNGLEEFSHIWLIWIFSEFADKEWNPTVRPPRLGGNERMGVFATRSPHRPNSLAMSCVELMKIEYKNHHVVLHVKGADLMNGTPVVDIKPYVQYSDARVDTRTGFVDKTSFKNLNVEFPEEMLNLIDETKRKVLIEILENDPRPRYQGESEDRLYGFYYSDYEIKFSVCDNLLTVISVGKVK